ncbi:MAG: xanthine dehydrogenase family protein subunit M [Thermomicrobium sp.]|nr:xanthine dehydrogenase family protein subunit M [Thermomicrobium sp.]
MIPGPFRYRRVHSVDEAVAVLSELGSDAKVLSGGQSLIPMMKFRLAEPSYLVDVNPIPGLDYIEERDGLLRLGALVRESTLERSPLIRERYPILHDTAEVIADPLVRNLATVGGNLAHGDPANDHPATMLALRAQLVAQGPSGTRVIPIDDFFVDTFVTALQPDELLTEIQIPVPPPRSGGAYLKFERKVGDYAIAAAAVFLVLDEAGRIAQAGIGLTNLAYKPLRAIDAERALVGAEPSVELFRHAADLAAQATDPVSDLRGPADYKRAVARTMTFRALQRAWERARGAA